MKYFFLFFFIICFFSPFAQVKPNAPVSYRAEIKRADGLSIVFNVIENNTKNKCTWIIKNASEQLKVDQIQIKGDSLIAEMPFFEASIHLKRTTDGYEGLWLKATATGGSTMPIQLLKCNKRILLPEVKQTKNISGRWKANFLEKDGSTSVCVAEFAQQGSKVTGTILTPTGDYRFLDGSISGDTLVLTTFDGSHAFVFTAHATSEGKLINGIFASGPTFKQSWNAIKDPHAKFNEEEAMMRPKLAMSTLSFRFPDLDSTLIGIKDERYKGKVVVLQIMGSWCPNCMDETAYLSKVYDAYHPKGLEIIGLAYEYSTDFNRSRKSLMKFHDRLHVKYPFLITGVTTSDPLRTEKTLPEMTPIKAFPSMIIIGKDGTIRKTHAGYSGPATGIHHEEFKKEFTALIEKLLKEE